jgi:hypothetical protein
VAVLVVSPEYYWQISSPRSENLRLARRTLIMAKKPVKKAPAKKAAAKKASPKKAAGKKAGPKVSKGGAVEATVGPAGLSRR